MRIAWLPTFRGAVAWHRTVAPAHELGKRGHQSVVVDPGRFKPDDQAELVRTADVVVISGPGGRWDDRPPALKESSGALVVEVDDDLWAFANDPAAEDLRKASLAAGGSPITPETLAAFEEWLREADLVTTTTEHLADVLRAKGTREVAVCPNALVPGMGRRQPHHADRPLLVKGADRNEPCRCGSGKKAKRCHEDPSAAPGASRRIGWTGSVAHRADLDPLLQAIRRVGSIDGQVEVASLGPVDFREQPAWQGYVRPTYARFLTEAIDKHGVKHRADTVPFELYYQALEGMAVDVAAIPLRASAFNLAKSSVTLLSWAIQEVPVVCSRTGPYAAAEAAGFPAVYVDHCDVDAWTRELRELLYDRAKARALARRAKAWVLEKHAYPAAADAWEVALLRAASR
jgi:glycosyltransferase involved in cell wall biosynthesis